MRGSLIILWNDTDGFGGDYLDIYVNNIIKKRLYSDSYNLYSTPLYVGDVVTIQFNDVVPYNLQPFSVYRRDYTTDDVGGDNGIKNTYINDGIISTSITFTATTLNISYDFEYRVNLLCFDTGDGFSGGNPPTITDIDLLSTGKYFISGEYTSYDNILANRIIQLIPDGTIYYGFNSGTGFQPDTTNQVVELSDGKLVIVGQFTNYNGTPTNRIIGLNADGSINTGFIYGAGFNTDAIPIERQTDDKLIIGGRFWTYKGITSPKIIRLNTDGSIDNTFVVGSGFTSGGTFTNIDVEVSCLAIQSDGKIIVGGKFDAYRGNSSNKIVRINTDGSYDSSFNVGTGFNEQPISIKIQPDGKVLVGGFFTTYNGSSKNYIVRLNSNGSIDTSFSGLTTGFDGGVNAIELRSDNKIIIGGEFVTYNGIGYGNSIICLNTDGTVNNSYNFGLGFNLYVFAILVLSDNSLLVGGNFTSYNGNEYKYFVKLDSTGNVVDCNFLN